MARLHHEAMEELAGLLAGLSDTSGTFEFSPMPANRDAAIADVNIATDNFVIHLDITTHRDAVEEEE